MITIWSNNIRSIVQPQHYYRMNRAIQEEKPHVVLLQETWLSKHKKVQFEGYKLFRRDSLTKPGHRGLAILIRSDISANVAKLPDISVDQTEILSVELRSYPPLTIHNVYHPPGVQAKTWEFSTNQGTIVAGDINGHHPSWSLGKPNETGNAFYEWSLEAAIEVRNIPQQVTRTQSSTSPDIMALDNSLNAIIDIRDGWGSDHLPLRMIIPEVKLKVAPNTSNKKWKWKWHAADWDKFGRLLDIAADKMKDIEDIPKLAARINNEIIRAATKAIPGYKMRIGKPFAVRDADLEALLDEKDPDQVDEEAINEGINKIKARIIESDVTGMDYRWAFRKVRQLEGGATEQSIKEIRHLGNRVTDPKEMAVAFTKTYADQFQLIEADSMSIPEDDDHESNQDFGMEEMLRHLHKLKEKKAPGPDAIWNTMLRRLPKRLLEELLRLFNLSWSKSKVPRCWKNGIIIPILKPGKDSTEILSYRPIALTSAVGKLFEHMIAERMHHLLKDKLSASQAAFRKGRDAIENLCLVTDKLLGTQVWEEAAVLLTFDLQKAFDAVQPTILLKRMMELGLPGKYVKWVRSYLVGRKITTKVNGVKGPYKSIKVGVPQGSVLGPILFTIYLDGLAKKLEEYKPTIFADDVGLVLTEMSPNRLEDKANNAVKIVERWALESHITINRAPGKTEFIYVNPDKKGRAPSVIYSEDHYFKYLVTTANFIRDLLQDENSTTISMDTDKVITHFYVVPPEDIKTELPNRTVELVSMKMDERKFKQLRRVRVREDILRQKKTGAGLPRLRTGGGEEGP
eukprot:TRINITY_DN157_c0_g1_i1.p1 TRINITY_DN157_c0_g1~~TRINITY_DN157_c0_g1_i1.p1  ORF type:complete len:797 (+),score=92.97 TRINITY_DN157_c0_g1_i1:1730-4120(+)